MARAHPAADQLTADELLIVGAIEAGTYFKENQVLTGTQNGINTVFTLPDTPNPVGSLEILFNGQGMKAGGEDFTLSGGQVTFNTAPISSDILLASYRVDPT